MDTQEKIEACERKKHDGNLLFKAENFMHASKKYEKVELVVLTYMLVLMMYSEYFYRKISMALDLVYNRMNFIDIVGFKVHRV